MISHKQHIEYFHFRCKIQLDLPVRVEPDGVLSPGHVDPDAPDAVPEVETNDKVAVLRAHCCWWC